MSKEDQRRSSCKKRSGQSLQLFESPKRLRDSMAKKTRNSLKRSFHRALLGIKHEEATENAVHNGHNLPKQTQFNDLNRKCIEHIFAFLTLKDKLNFRKGMIYRLLQIAACCKRAKLFSSRLVSQSYLQIL